MKTDYTPTHRNKLFYAVSSLLFLIAAFLFLCQYFITPELIYPVRVDSLFVKYEAERIAGLASSGEPEKTNHVFFNPLMLGMNYDSFPVKTDDGLILQGWFIPANEEGANTLLIIHDLSQGKWNYLNMMKQMHDRGLNVCAMDLRAHGTSEGDEFSPGMVTVADMKSVTDSLLKRKGTNRLAIFGAGMGTAAAIQSAGFDGRADVLILQSPFRNFSEYVDGYAKRKWNDMDFLFRAVLRRELEKRLQYDLDLLDLSEIIKYVKVPTLIIAAGNDDVIPLRSSKTVYDCSGAKEKKLYLVEKAQHQNIEVLGGESYYNFIAEFVISSMPRKQKETRFKKLAQNDQQGYH